MADDVDPIAAEFEQQRKRNAEADEVARINARTPGEQLNRDIRATGTGVNDAIGSAIGAVPDAIGAGMRAVGLPSSAPGQYTKWAQGGLNAAGDAIYGKLKPDTPAERNLYAAGHGAGDALSMVVPAAGAARLGGVVGGVAGQLAENPITQAIAGAAGGSATQASGSPLVGLGVSMLTPFAGSAARGVISPGASQLNPEQAALAATATREGIPLRPGQLSGSKPMQNMESVFKDLPLTSGPARADEEAQRVAFNRAVLARAGEHEATHATPAVVNAALERSGQRMSDIYARNNFTVDGASMQNVQAVADHANRYLPESVRQPVLNRIEDFTSKVRSDGQGGFQVEGPAFAALDSELSRHLRSTNDGQVRDTLQRLREALRTGMEASISGEDADALAEARRQYANGKVIQAAINTPSAATAAGHVPPLRISTTLAAGPGNNYARGSADLHDLGNIGRAFVQDPIPNSGTAMRRSMQALLTGGPLFTGSYLGGADPLHAALLASGGIALPSIIQQLARSRAGQAYLTNQAAAGWAPQATRGTLAGIGGAQLPGLLGTPPGPGPRVAPLLDPRFQPQ